MKTKKEKINSAIKIKYEIMLKDDLFMSEKKYGGGVSYFPFLRHNLAYPKMDTLTV